MKKTPLQRKTPLKRFVNVVKDLGYGKKPSYGLSRRKAPLSASKKKQRKQRSKLPKISTMRNKADALLTPIIKMMYPTCLLCPQPTQVAHHHIHKSQSSAVRYHIPNLINLCNHCHVVLHNNESFWASKVVQIKGIEWFNALEITKNTPVKTDIHFYISHYERLKAIYDEEETATAVTQEDYVVGYSGEGWGRTQNRTDSTTPDAEFFT